MTISPHQIPWMNWRRVYYAISVIALILAIVPLAMGKLQPAIEFTGGSRLIVSSPSENFVSTLQTVLEEQEIEAEPVKPRTEYEYEVLTTAMDLETKNAVLAEVENRTSVPTTEIRFQTVGPSLGRELIEKTAYAIVLGVITILVYLWWQFKDWRFGLAGIAAMLHDTTILVGAFAWLGWFAGVRVDVLFVTAVLTTLSFSVHDTIVVFDQVRELQRKKGVSDAAERANMALSQTLTRSLNNSLTILFMLAALVLLGGESLRWFAVALFVGTLTGTYSSTFTALPLYVDLVRKK